MSARDREAEEVVPPWQVPVLEDLRSAREQDRLPHALLLDGPRGWAKRFFARQFARELLGLAPADPARCRFGDEEADQDLMTHPDCRIVRRTPSAGTGRLRQQITVDQIRELGEFLVRTAGAGGARVAIVELAEELNVNAGNALLKRLEEPGPGTHLLLVTSQSSRVLATVRSRCQRLLMPPGARSLAEAWLAGNPDASSPDGSDGTQPARLLDLAGGAPLRALEFVGGEVTQLADEVEAVLDRGAAPDRLIASDQRQEPDAARDRAALVLELLYRAVAARIRDCADAPGAPSQRGLQALLDRIVRARRQLASSANPNVTLLLEDLLLGARGSRRPAADGRAG
jgi:DNA polymerase-3 subunit delta'